MKSAPSWAVPPTLQWPQESQEINQASQSPILWSVTHKDKNRLSAVQPDWTPFYFGESPLIITWIGGDRATIIDPLSNRDEIKYVTILWENNQPKILKFINGEELLCVVPKDMDDDLDWEESNKISLMNRNGHILSTVPYPLENIKQKEGELLKEYVVKEKNEYFYKCFCVNNWSEIMLYKKWDTFTPVRLKNETPRDIWAFEKLPTKDVMCLVWKSLMFWDEEQEMFRLVKKHGREFRGVTRDNRRPYNFNIVDETRWRQEYITEFSVSKENPKEPAFIDINGESLLIAYLNEDWRDTRNSVKINEECINIYLDVFFDFTWHRFFMVENHNHTKNPRYTDWKRFYKFQVNKKWEVQFFDYAGKKYPIIDTVDGWWKSIFSEEGDSFNWVKHLVLENWGPKEVIQIKNKKQEGKKEWAEYESEILQESNYTRIIFTPEQSELNVIQVYPEHGIVCLAKDVTNTSRYEFYRVNPDGTLTFVFSDNYKIHIFNRQVRISGSMQWNTYNLIRRPNTTSIFEPMVINNSEYIVAKWNMSWEVLYISIENGSIKNIDKREIDPRSFLPAHSFIFGDETLYYNSDGRIKIWDTHYSLVNSQGKLVTSPEQAIFSVWDKKILLIIQSDLDSIAGYIPGTKEENSPCLIAHIIKISEGVYRIQKREVIKATVEDQECICRYDYGTMNTLWIVETTKEGFSPLRYVNKKDVEWKLQWEEFTCNWEKVVVTKILSPEYLVGYISGRNEIVYYRAWMDKNITPLDLPKGVKFSNGPYCKVSFGRNWDPDFNLLTKQWKLVPISDEYKDFYLLEDSTWTCRLNGKKIHLTHTWDQKENRIISFTKKWKTHKPFMVWWRPVWNDEQGTFVFYWPESENPKILYFSDNNLKVSEKAYIIMDEEDEQKDTRWRKVYNVSDGIWYTWPVYEVDGKPVPVLLHWHEIVIVWWEVTIDGIKYNEKLLDELYERLRPKSTIKDVKDVLWDVPGKVIKVLPDNT